MKIQWRSEFDRHLSRIESISDTFPWENRTAYAWWLAQTYYLVRHTTRFIALTAARVPFEKNALHYDLMEHCREEAGHDKLALNDLTKLGFTLEQLPPLAETTALYRAQYFALEYASPVSHFGYSFCFEGYAARRAGAIQQIVERSFGRGIATFLAVHAVVDQHHFERAFEILHTLNDEEGAAILENLELSCLLYEGMMKRILQEKVDPSQLGVRKPVSTQADTQPGAA